MPPHKHSRRTFLTYSAVLPFALKVPRAATTLPVGLELYSVRNELARDPQATLRAVASFGYQDVEFYSPYFQWTESQAKDTKKLLDDLGMRCLSTHNDSSYFTKENLSKAADYNSILGSKYVVMASSKPNPGVPGWKEIADTLNSAATQLASSGLKPGYHNHQLEFTPIPDPSGSGTVRPIEVLAKNTTPDVMLQLDVGTCLQVGSDPVAWIRANPGRIHSVHCKDWAPGPDRGYAVLFGEGVADWKNIFAAAESVGGVEYYLVEQEGSRFPELLTAQKCLSNFRTQHPA